MSTPRDVVVYADYGSINPAYTRVLRYFECDHLSEPMWTVAKSFQSLAWRLADAPTSDQLEMEHGLETLLVAKDHAVRAVLPPMANRHDQPEDQ